MIFFKLSLRIFLPPERPSIQNNVSSMEMLEWKTRYDELKEQLKQYKMENKKLKKQLEHERKRDVEFEQIETE